MFEELTKLFADEEGMPALTLEVNRKGGQVVRVPAWDDGYYVYTGGVFAEEHGGYVVTVDGGKAREFKELAEAWQWFEEAAQGG